MKMINCFVLSGNIRLLTGLHIGAGKDAIEIGGMDNPIIKNPFTGEPYIPGSSIKGKMRSLLEWATGRVDENGKVWDGGGIEDSNILKNDPILRIFGNTNKKWDAGPTRLIVRDAFLNQEWRDDIIERGLPFTEEKMEVSIDRIQGKATGAGPRKTERVPAGALFDMVIIYRIFDLGDEGETDKKFFDYLLKGMKLLENDALGGSGSRGYGRVKFENLKQDGADIQDKLDKLNPEELLNEIGRAA